jgi:hypothetical protein
MVPPFSVAAGLDFGNYKPILGPSIFESDIYSLPDLTFLESLLISRVVVHYNLVKLQWHCGHGQLALKGNCVVFTTDGVEQAMESLPRLELKTILAVKYYGRGADLQSAKMQMRTMKQFSVQSAKISRWLCFLKKFNPFYYGVQQNPNFVTASEEEFQEIIKNAIDDVFEHSENVDGIMAETIATNDISRTEETDGADELQFTLLEGKSLTTKPTNGDILRRFDECLDTLNLEVRESSTPVNEFESYSEIMYGGFPTLFPLGSGIPGKGTFHEALTRHLLRFYDQRFSKNKLFIFYMLNCKLRHAAIRQSDLYVKSNPESIRVVTELLCSANLNETIRQARANPDGEEAMRLLAILKEHVHGAGGSLPFSNGERRMHMSQIQAYCRHFGPPSFFVTAAPNEVNSNLICTFLREYGLDTNQRKAMVNEHPVACAEVFYRTIEHVMTDLIGMEPANRRRASPVPNQGLLGTPLAYFGVIETQGRGSLHIHFLLWTKLAPRKLQSMVTNPIAVDLVGEVLDSMISGYIPLEYHISNRDRLNLQIPFPQIAFDTTVTGSKNLHFWDRAHKLAAAYQTHVHSFTCHKGRYGKSRCRLARPQHLSEKTKPVQIISALGSTDIIMNHEFYLEENEPFENDDPRLLFWHIKRPTITTAGKQEHASISNGLITEFNPTLTNLLGCNTCVSFLGSSSESKSAAYYMSKYMGKDPVAIASTLSCIIHALETRDVPSIADDAGTDSRQTKLFLQRILNKQIGLAEYSQTLCAAILLGHESSIKSHDTSWLYTDKAVKKYQETITISTAAEVEDPSDDDNEISEDAQQPLIFEVLKDMGPLSNGPSSPSVPLSKLQNQSMKPGQHIDYFLRGEALRHLNLYEYAALIRHVPFKKSSRTKIQANGPGRPGLTRYAFEQEHPLSATVSQIITTKPSIPAFAGASFPSWPGTRKVAKFSKGKAAKWALFVYVTFVPWGKNIQSPNPTYDLMVQILRGWRNGSSIERKRYQLVQNISKGLTISASSNAIYNEYRGMYATRWSDEDKLRFQSGPQVDIVELSKHISEPSLREYSTKERIFLEHSLGILERVFSREATSAPTFRNLSNSNCTVIAAELLIAKPTHTPNQAVLVRNFVHTSTPTTTLNCDQEAVKKFLLQKVLEEQVQVLLLINGGPGTGKSTLVNSITSHLKAICCAPTGIAATLLQNGSTIDSLFGTGFMPNPSPPPLDTKSLENLQLEFEGVRLLIIDEISMVDWRKLHQIHIRLQQIQGNRLPFGGISVIGCGDFYQLPPVTGESWQATMLSERFESFEKASATRLMRMFHLSHLTIQQRSNEGIHTVALERCRSGDSNIPGIIHSMGYQVLSEAEQSRWNEATVLVTSNVERHHINLARIKQQAKSSGRPVICWKKELGSATTLLSGSYADPLFTKYPESCHYFLHGAPAIIEQNINVTLGIANGTKATLHSLTLDPRYITEDIRTIQTTTAGDLAIIHTPMAVNVELNEPIHHNLKSRWPKDACIADDQTAGVIIPLTHKMKNAKTDINKKLKLDCFPFDLRYAMTFYKCQGQTLGQVIMDIRKRPHPMPNINHPAFYVGFSRVRNRDSIRFLPFEDAKTRALLESMKPDPQLQQWYSRYKSIPGQPVQTFQ